MASTVIKQGTKVGIACVAVYWSVQQGIWGTTQEGSEAMRRLRSTITTQVLSDADQLTQRPHNTHASHPRTPIQSPRVYTKDVVPAKANKTILGSWNNGMKTVFETASNLPELAAYVSEKATTSISNLVKAD